LKKTQKKIYVFFVILSNLVCLHAALKDSNANKAVRITIKSSSFLSELEGEPVPLKQTYLLLTTQWQNIHPKQKIEKEKLEKKQDHTMGVKQLTEKKESEQEYVYADVAYMVEKLSDHVYCLADGLAYSLSPLTEQIQEGVSLSEPFTITKKGEVRDVSFVFALPQEAQNLAFQFFDYEYGNISLPVKGSLQDAHGIEGPPEGALSYAKCALVEAAVHSISFSNEFQEEPAPDGWRFAKVRISGQSLSGGSIKNIVQIEPKEYIWLTADGGYLYYAVGGTTTEEGFIRFTPEFFQRQEVSFLVPGSARIDSLGLRIQNQVLALPFNPEKEIRFPEPAVSHQDGSTMKVMVFSAEKTDSSVILDLGIQSLVSSGIEIMREQQFILVDEGRKIYMDEELTDSLFHRPPSPFIIPPETFVRFRLAYQTDSLPSVLYFRGFESEKNIEVSDIRK
jgi:hypothetical protein